MNEEELIKARDLVKEQHDNLSNANWVAAELHHLRGKYDILNEVIESIQKEGLDAANSKAKQANSNHNKGK